IAVLGVVAGGLTLIPAVPPATLLWVSLLGLAIGLMSMLWEWGALRRKFRDSELAERNPVFPGVVPFDDDLPDTFRTERGTLLHSAALDGEMCRGRGWHAEMRNEKYRLPEGLRDVAPFILRRTSGGSLHFNGVCVRMLGDCRVDGSAVLPFQPAGFFDLLCSNDLMRWQISRGPIPWDVRAEYLYDENHRLLPLASSELANVVGVATLAISQDRRVLIVEQSPANHASQGLLAPSGSGSLEPKDFDEDLQTFALNGANREFVEETGVDADRIIGSRLISFGRWLERGAKPEFFGLTLLEGTAETIDRGRRKVGGAEAMYTRRATWIPLEALLDPTSERRAVMSLPLAFALRSLGHALQADPDLLSTLPATDSG
ncbi:MAG TPA: NUDIX hydrolase, partial [Brevibacterium sp.]|nr:NUDIX hydrolase [Brevibacterium sp.]